jgi:hypothetical protein
MGRHLMDARKVIGVIALFGVIIAAVGRVLEMDAKEWIALFGVIIAAVGGGLAIWTYRSNTRLKRAEWLDKLYTKFYEINKLQTHAPDIGLRTGARLW